MGAAKLVKGTTSSRQVVRQDVEDPQIGRLRDADLFAFLIEIRITLRRIIIYALCLDVTARSNTIDSKLKCNIMHWLSCVTSQYLKKCILM